MNQSVLEHPQTSASSFRAWQLQALTSILDSSSQDFLAVATPGAGKTRLAVGALREWFRQGMAFRAIVVCPTNHLKEQWAKAASSVLQLDPTFTNDREREARDYHGIVVSYQQVCLAPALYARLCQQMKTAVIFDEIHHAGDGKEWGDALKAAFGGAGKRLALSGTPFRSDDAPIPFVRYEDNRSVADFTYGYGDALRDGVCRPILFPSYEGELSWRSSDGKTKQATFETLLNKRHRAERLKTAITHGDWLGSVILDADQRITEIREKGARDAGGLVVAMSQAHAQEVAALIQSKTGRTARIAISDEPDASRTIKQFAGSQDRWLVAVNMVSEGVDIPRLRVGVYATNILTEMYFRQVVGRFVRMQSAYGNRQEAYLYIPHDPTLVHYAMQIQEERRHFMQRPEDKDEGMPLLRLMNERTASEYLAMSGVAQVALTIGVDTIATVPVPDFKSEMVPPLHEAKGALRETHRRLVGKVAKKSGLDHRAINLELHKRTGGWIDTATMTQLKKRITILETWVDRGYDGARA